MMESGYMISAEVISNFLLSFKGITVPDGEYVTCMTVMHASDHLIPAENQNQDLKSSEDPLPDESQGPWLLAVTSSGMGKIR